MRQLSDNIISCDICTHNFLYNLHLHYAVYYTKINLFTNSLFGDASDSHTRNTFVAITYIVIRGSTRYQAYV